MNLLQNLVAEPDLTLEGLVQVPEGADAGARGG